MLPPLGYDDTNGTPVMTHPTDDELEAMADRLMADYHNHLIWTTATDQKKADWVKEAAAMLRACKAGDAPDHTQWNAAIEAAAKAVMNMQGRFVMGTPQANASHDVAIVRLTEIIRILKKGHPHD